MPPELISFRLENVQVSDPSKARRGLSTVEVVALSIVVAAATWTVAVSVHTRQLRQHAFFSGPGFTESEPFRAYGPARSSRDFEEWIIRDFFKDRRGGVFLDVGANHFQNDSNTYFLETALGWSGVAVDALEEFAADYKTHRPRTKFVAMFASDVADTTVQFFVPKDNPLVASANRDFTIREGAEGTPRTVPTTTLNAVLDQAGIARINLLSMDIELAEPKALAGFDIARFAPELVCIEAHPDVRQEILDYFHRHGYVVVGRYLRADPKNLYFMRSAPGAHGGA